jgi:hypothetical protein
MTSYRIPKCSKSHTQQAHSLSAAHSPVGQMHIAEREIAGAQQACLPVHVRQASLAGGGFIATLTVLLSLLLVAGFAQPVAAQQTLLGLSSSPKRPSLLWQAGISLSDSVLPDDLHAHMDISKRTGLFGFPADAFSPFSLSESPIVDRVPRSGKRSRAIEASLTVPLVRQRFSRISQTSYSSRLSFDLEGGLGVLADDPRGFDGRNGMSFSKMLGARLTYLMNLANRNITLSAGYRFQHTSNASLANAGVRQISYGPHAFFAEVSYSWS